ncbi:MAG: energy-coupling factor transporter ATPase, partial [Lutispora sp.]|nr:energy-coupling factor transporter ATPase [Lutispora sp.]
MPIKVENLVHIYMRDTVFQHLALDDVSFTIEDGE